MIRVVVADDHPLFREGVKKIVNAEEDMRVVAESGDGSSVFAMVASGADLLLLDVNLPDRSGMDILKDMREQHPTIPVLLFSMHGEEVYGVRAIKAGAAGYLNKMLPASTIVSAIRKAASGKKFITPLLAEKLANEVEGGTTKALHELLSDREFEIMLLIARGRTPKEVGELLSISVNTVNTYRARIFDKMKMQTNMDLAYYAIENNLLK